MKLFRWFFAPLLAAFHIACSAFLTLVRSARPAGDLALSLDHLARDAAALGRKQRSRFASFVERARTHDLFIAGHFDPGRLPA